jgi:hypothetical protein
MNLQFMKLVEHKGSFELNDNEKKKYLTWTI